MKEEGENFDYYTHEIDLLNRIAGFLQKLIEECDRIFYTKHYYKVTKVKVEDALCEGTDKTELEKNLQNLAEKGLTYLVKIEEIKVSMWKKILLISSIIVGIFGIVACIGLIFYLGTLTATSILVSVISALVGSLVQDINYLVEFNRTGDFSFLSWLGGKAVLICAIVVGGIAIYKEVGAVAGVSPAAVSIAADAAVTSVATSVAVTSSSSNQRTAGLQNPNPTQERKVGLKRLFLLGSIFTYSFYERNINIQNSMTEFKEFLKVSENVIASHLQMLMNNIPSLKTYLDNANPSINSLNEKVLIEFFTNELYQNYALSFESLDFDSDAFKSKLDSLEDTIGVAIGLDKFTYKIKEIFSPIIDEVCPHEEKKEDLNEIVQEDDTNFQGAVDRVVEQVAANFTDKMSEIYKKKLQEVKMEQEKAVKQSKEAYKIKKDQIINEEVNSLTQVLQPTTKNAHLQSEYKNLGGTRINPDFYPLLRVKRKKHRLSRIKSLNYFGKSMVELNEMVERFYQNSFTKCLDRLEFLKSFVQTTKFFYENCNAITKFWKKSRIGAEMFFFLDTECSVSKSNHRWKIKALTIILLSEGYDFSEETDWIALRVFESEAWFGSKFFEDIETK